MEDTHKDGLVHRCKELANIALQDPARAGIVLAYLISKAPETLHRLVRPLPHSAGIRIGNKDGVKEGVELAIEGMVEEAVANGGLMDVAWFRVGDLESMVAAMSVDLAREIALEVEDIVREPILKCLYVWLFALAL